MGYPIGLKVLFVLLLLWALFWKAAGLWHAARRGQLIWFIVFSLVNTLGILEIIYLFVVSKMSWKDVTTLPNAKRE